MSGVIAGLACALNNVSRKVYLVDAAPVAGGSFSSFATPDGNLFDRGIHLIPQVLDQPFDTYFQPEFGYSDEFWAALTFPRRDRSGNIVSDTPNARTSLLNVDQLPDALVSVRTEFMNATPVPFEECQSAGNFIETNLDLHLRRT